VEHLHRFFNSQGNSSVASRRQLPEFSARRYKDRGDIRDDDEVPGSDAPVRANLGSMAVRTLARDPAFTVTAVAILAMGIGANSTMFSILQSVLLRPVPWEDPDRLALLQEVQRNSGDTTNPSTANYVDVRDQSDVFERIAPFRFVYFNLSDGRADPERVQGLRLTSDFFRLIGVKPALGRLFVPEEERKGGDRAVLLANGLWRQRYSSDPAIVGKTVILEGEAHTIVGVLPEFPIFHVLNRALDIYVPLILAPGDLSRQDHSITVYARLRQGISLEMAQSEMEAISRRLATQYPETNTGLSLQLTPLADAMTSNRRSELEFLMAATAVVLLVACANIASLTLAWTISRQRELAIRMALGAAQSRIIGQLITESLIVTLAGAGVGLLASAWATALLNRSLSYTLLGRINDFQIDAAGFAFAAGISLVACTLFGLGPAILRSKFGPSHLIASAGSRGASGRNGIGQVLIACEIALATMLVTCTVLVASSAMRLLTVDRGVDTAHTLCAQLWLPATRYPTTVAERQFVDRVLEQVGAIPGVEAASVVNYPPLGLLGTAVDFVIEGRPTPTPLTTRFRVVDSKFFPTLRVPLLAGRAFTQDDADPVHGVAIVSNAFARRFFAGENPLGQLIRPRFPGGDAFWYPQATNHPLRIVGIARDVNEQGIDVGPLPQIYLPFTQNPSRILHLLVRTQGPPLRWASAIRTVILKIDSNEPLFEVRTYAEIIEQTFSRQRAFAGILGAAAGLALILSACGVYARTVKIPAGVSDSL
jgi:putative ABC transport system permease protein